MHNAPVTKIKPESDPEPRLSFFQSAARLPKLFTIHYSLFTKRTNVSAYRNSAMESAIRSSMSMSLPVIFCALESARVYSFR